MLAFGRVCHLFLLVFCVYVWLNPHQVMQVVREQITRALAMKPSSIDQLKTKLRGLNYSEILRLRQSERMSQDDFQSPPIMSVCVHTTFLSHYLPWECGCNFFFPLLRKSVRLLWCLILETPAALGVTAKSGRRQFWVLWVVCICLDILGHMSTW